MRQIYNRKLPTEIQAMKRCHSIAHYDLVTQNSEEKLQLALLCTETKASCSLFTYLQGVLSPLKAPN
jgi:hypothetical protein